MRKTNTRFLICKSISAVRVYSKLQKLSCTEIKLIKVGRKYFFCLGYSEVSTLLHTNASQSAFVDRRTGVDNYF